MEAIINDYIKTAEPVASRTIAKKYDFGISSATIRNEMSDLEDMGLIIQPHSSSGRIPSDKGYRFYVDTIMDYRELTKDEEMYLKSIVFDNINQIDYYMKETAKAISLLTNYTSIVCKPTVNKAKIKLIQLLPLDEKNIVLILIMDNKSVNNYTVNIGESLKSDYLNILTNILNNNLYLFNTDISNEDLLKVKCLSENEKNIVYKLLTIVNESINKIENLELYTSGIQNMLEFPEFNNVEKIKGIFQTFEEKDMLINLLDDAFSDDIQIEIGAENGLENMKDFSIIKAKYKIDEQTSGKIAIIGPKRMDYIQVVSLLNSLTKNINKSLICKENKNVIKCLDEKVINQTMIKEYDISCSNLENIKKLNKTVSLSNFFTSVESNLDNTNKNKRMNEDSS